MEGERDWTKKHGEVITTFLRSLYANTNQYILKGGTALLTCYGLNRFSEDIDLDGFDRNIEKHITDFCKKSGYTYRVAKDTETVKRYMINYGDAGKPLKVEVSFRRKSVSSDEVVKINGIIVYSINTLCAMKAGAYSARDKIRDLYDVSFITNHYWKELTPATITVLRNNVSEKGIEQFDYLLQTQNDPLIDKSKLAESFLTMYERLGLLYDADEKKLIDKSIRQNRDEPKRIIKKERESEF